MPGGWRSWYSNFMLLWAVASNTFLVLQLVKIYQFKNATGVSFPAYIVYIFGAMVWMVYGAFVLNERNWAIVVNSSLAFMLASAILAGIVKYGNIKE